MSAIKLIGGNGSHKDGSNGERADGLFDKTSLQAAFKDVNSGKKSVINR